MSTITTFPYKILVVEDEMIVAMDLESHLERLGYTVATTAYTGEGAIKAAETERPDLILMDIELRGPMDAITAASDISQRFDLPVIFLTASTDGEFMSRARESKPYGFLRKPFRPEELNTAIEIALRQHRACQKLFTERGWLSTMCAGVSDGVIASDADGHIRFLNPAAVELTGWLAGDAVGKPIEQVYSLSYLNGDPVEHCQLRKALLARKFIDKERFLVRTRNGLRAVEDAAAPIIDEGLVLGAVTIFSDISSQTHTEERSADGLSYLSHGIPLISAAPGQTREDFQALARHLMMTQEEEGGRIARELHDDLGQQAALLGMQADQLEGALSPESRMNIGAIRAGLDTLAQGLRDVSHRLHPSIIADLGLPEALASLVTEFRSQGLSLTASLSPADNVPLEVSTSLYRIAQEGLRNVMKHTPHSAVRLVLSRASTEIGLQISDDGAGFSLDEARRKGGFGLMSMQERARSVGGDLQVTTMANRGTSIQVRVPLTDGATLS